MHQERITPLQAKCVCLTSVSKASHVLQRLRILTPHCARHTIATLQDAENVGACCAPARSLSNAAFGYEPETECPTLYRGALPGHGGAHLALVAFSTPNHANLKRWLLPFNNVIGL
jgi:hypothetical protein